MFETLELDVDDRGVATLMLNRPEKHNALSAQMISELTTAAQRLGDASDVRCVVLTGAGRSFCAGGDLGWMKEQIEADAEGRATEARRLAGMLHALNTIPKPLIGRLQGQAFGGGIGLACVCDVAIGVTGAKFGLTETRLGLIPATIGPYVVARIGEASARRVFMSARIFDATEAAGLGVLSRVVAPDDLNAAIDAEVTPYFDAAPAAVAQAKALVRRLGTPIDDAAVDDSIKALVACWDGAEAAEGIAAFFDKRPAAWMQGRKS